LIPFDRKFMSPKTARCMHRGPNFSALRTPVQFLGGCGGFQRKSPMGGSAKGIPLNSRTPVAESVVPASVPLAVFTWSAANAPDAVRSNRVLTNVYFIA